ncbi:MAG: hypothetical protein IIC54_09710 [Proteobacteria bacterium]|nr:hypothetical protein [Pseudomonadota bacterium]MCH7957160.1 hypothetical protein [Pseudomonadota bacterium]MCH8214328.1 hypothetical protein [Pseudomonadota bacterium]
MTSTPPATVQTGINIRNGATRPSGETGNPPAEAIRETPGCRASSSGPLVAIPGLDQRTGTTTAFIR